MFAKKQQLESKDKNGNCKVAVSVDWVFSSVFWPNTLSCHSCAYIFHRRNLEANRTPRKEFTTSRQGTNRPQTVFPERQKKECKHNNTPFPFLLFPKPPFCFIKGGSEEEEEAGNSLLPSFPPLAIGPAIKPNQGPIQPTLSFSLRRHLESNTQQSNRPEKRGRKEKRPEAFLSPTQLPHSRKKKKPPSA